MQGEAGGESNGRNWLTFRKADKAALSQMCTSIVPSRLLPDNWPFFSKHYSQVKTKLTYWLQFLQSFHLAIWISSCFSRQWHALIPPSNNFRGFFRMMGLGTVCLKWQIPTFTIHKQSQTNTAHQLDFCVQSNLREKCMEIGPKG